MDWWIWVLVAVLALVEYARYRILRRNGQPVLLSIAPVMLPEPRCESERDLIDHFIARNRHHLPLLCAAIDGLMVPLPTPAKRYFALHGDDGDDFYVVARNPEDARRIVIYQGIQFGDPSMGLAQAEAEGLVTWSEIDIEKAERIHCTVPLADCELGELLGNNQ